MSHGKWSHTGWGVTREMWGAHIMEVMTGATGWGERTRSVRCRGSTVKKERSRWVPGRDRRTRGEHPRKARLWGQLLGPSSVADFFQNLELFLNPWHPQLPHLQHQDHGLSVPNSKKCSPI